jgi:thrombospondin type 3 repeat protein
MRGLAIAIALLVGGCDLVFEVTVYDPTTDEDLDGVPNLRDNCPGIFNPKQEDTGELVALIDADGVGDACDPKIEDPGDAVIARYFFTDPLADGEQWIADGDWTFEDGYAEVDATGTVATLEAKTRAPLDQARTTVEVGIEVIGENDTGSFAAGIDFFDRRVEIDPGNPPTIALISTSVLEAPDPVSVALPRTIVLQLRRERANATSLTDLKGFIRNLNDVDKGSDAPATDPMDSGRVLVRIANVHVRVHHVLVYGTPGLAP